jgi:hypothetical protein
MKRDELISASLRGAAATKQSLGCAMLEIASLPAVARNDGIINEVKNG